MMQRKEKFWYLCEKIYTCTGGSWLVFDSFTLVTQKYHEPGRKMGYLQVSLLLFAQNFHPVQKLGLDFLEVLPKLTENSILVSGFKLDIPL